MYIYTYSVINTFTNSIKIMFVIIKNSFSWLLTIINLITHYLFIAKYFGFIKTISHFSTSLPILVEFKNGCHL